MPHSSGGGSHHGGSHHSHHSSRSSHSSHSSSGTSNRSSSKPFTGATRYVYYRNRQPVFVYSNYDIRKTSNAGNITLLVFFLCIIAFFTVVGLIAAINVPKKIDTSSYSTEVTITDTIGIIDNEVELESTLQDFYNETGISPVILTVYNSDWEGKYDDLETFAYSYYLQEYDDEKHWLLVYSEPETPNPDFNDWYWEGMQGDDTDGILTYAIADEFDKELHKDLLRESKLSVGEAFVKAFELITPNIMNTTFEPLYMLLPAVFTAISSLFILGLLLDIFSVKQRYYKKSVVCPDTLVDQEACEYCGGIYVVGLDTKCPHCGAPVKPHDFTVDADGNVTNILN